MGAAEVLRGVGGLILDKTGKRFANELGRRDYVTGEMWKNKPPFRLVLNKAASDEIIWHCKHYTGRGVMKFYESGEALAKDWVLMCRYSLIHMTSITMQRRRPRRILMVVAGQHIHRGSLGMQPADLQAVARSFTITLSQVLQ